MQSKYSYGICALLVGFFVIVAFSFSQYITATIFLNDQTALAARTTVKSEAPRNEGDPYAQLLYEDLELSDTDHLVEDGGVAGMCSASFDVDYPVVGDQRIAVILVDFAQDGSAQSVSEIEKGIFSAPKSTKNFIEAASFGKTTISGDIFGWYAHAPLAGCTPTDAEFMEMMNMVPTEVDLTEYSRFAFVFNGHGTTCQGGVSTLGNISLQTPDGTVCASRLWVRDRFILPNDFSQTTHKTFAHELLHSFGVPFHANAYVCATTTLPEDNAGCTIGSYGDVFDIMGLSSQASHPNAVIKEQLGWLNRGHVAEVPSDPGQYSYTLSSISKNSPQLKTISIDLPYPIAMKTATGGTIDAESLSVEYRDMTGFDFRSSFYRNIPLVRGGVFSITNTDGAIVRAINCSMNNFCITDLLDMHPTSIVNPSYAPNKVANAYLFAGETFTVPGNPISIQTVSASAGQSVDVRVIIENQCPGDFDQSGVVDGVDLAVLLGVFDTKGTNMSADINHDNVADAADLGILLGAWGACPLL